LKPAPIRLAPARRRAGAKRTPTTLIDMVGEKREKSRKFAGFFAPRPAVGYNEIEGRASKPET
jgi:hypothetical protein